MKVLFLSSHPDDVEFNAGGTLTRFLDEGMEIHWIVFTEPDNRRMKEARAVVDMLGEKYGTEIPVIFHGFEDKHLEKNRQEVLDILFDIGDILKPDIVIGPHKDLHQDHRCVYNEMLRAFGHTSSIWCYEPGTAIDFHPRLYIQLTKEHIDNKLRMIALYKSQKDKRYARKGLIIARARYWGSKAGAEYAEAFDIVRHQI